MDNKADSIVFANYILSTTRTMLSNGLMYGMVQSLTLIMSYYLAQSFIRGMIMNIIFVLCLYVCQKSTRDFEGAYVDHSMALSLIIVTLGLWGTQ